MEGAGPGLGSVRRIRGTKTKEALALRLIQARPGPLAFSACASAGCLHPEGQRRLACCALLSLVQGAWWRGRRSSRVLTAPAPTLTSGRVPHVTPPPPRMYLTLTIFSVVAPDPGCTLGGLRLWQVAATRPALPPTPLPSYSDCSSLESRPSYLSHPTPLKPGVGT